MIVVGHRGWSIPRAEAGDSAVKAPTSNANERESSTASRINYHSRPHARKVYEKWAAMTRPDFGSR